MSSVLSATFVLAILLAAATMQPPAACPTEHVLSAMPGMTPDCNCNAAIERQQPIGTQVYSYDQYVVLDGRRNVHFSIHAKFSCDAVALHAYDPHTGARASFSMHARIIRLRDGREVFVFPGHAMSIQLKRDVMGGVAYFKTVIKAK